MKFKKYIAILKINFANRMAYPIDIFSETFFMAFIFSILYFLHRATATITPTSLVEHLSLAQVMWIIFFANIFAGERSKGVSFIVNEEILSGQIAYQFNRPYSYIMFHFVQNLGSRLPIILFIGPITGFCIYLAVGFPCLSLGNMVIGSIMLGIGMVMTFLMQFCIGLCAFWIGNVDPLRWIYGQILMVCGGAAVPVALFPAAVKKVLLLLPFSNVVYGAARIIVGCSQNDLVMYLGLQLFWLIVLLFITRLLFKYGVKHVVISGG